MGDCALKKGKLEIKLKTTNFRPNREHIKKIIRLGMPIAFQDLLVSISFLVILAIVNNLGLNESAGVGVAEKVCMFILLIPSAYMQAMSAFVAQNVGAKEYGRAKKALLYGIASSLTVGVIVGYFSFFHGDILARIFTKDASREICNQLIKLGVKGFLNFSHYDISLEHSDVQVENIHFGDSLMTLSYKLSN